MEPFRRLRHLHKYRRAAAIPREGSSFRFFDFRATLRMRFDAGTGWGGISFRKDQSADAAWASGYNLFMRPNGQLVLNVQPTAGGSDVTLATSNTGIDPSLPASGPTSQSKPSAHGSASGPTAASRIDVTDTLSTNIGGGLSLTLCHDRPV